MCRPSPSGPDHLQAITRSPPNTPKNLVPPGGLPESVQIPLDLGRLRNITAKRKRTRSRRWVTCDRSAHPPFSFLFGGRNEEHRSAYTGRQAAQQIQCNE